MNQLNGYDVEDLRVGMSASFSKTITEADLVLFAGVSGDNNAMHVNEEFAAATPFGGRIAHGMLTASVISAAIANKMPGPGTIYLGQNLRFREPVRPGETVHATVTVTQISVDRRRVTLSTVCRVRQRIVIDGDALVMTTTSQSREVSARKEVGLVV
jgi:3-hydroxybutyryl-CoA dehydratase